MKKLKDLLHEFTAKLIKEQLIIHNGDLVKTARSLGIQMKQLYNYRLDFPWLEEYVTKRKSGPIESDETREKRRIINKRFPSGIPKRGN